MTYFSSLVKSSKFLYQLIYTLTYYRIHYGFSYCI